MTDLASLDESWILLILAVEVLAEELGHCEHVDAVLLEDGAHEVVAENMPLIRGVLELMFSDVLPYLFDGLRPRELVDN